MSATPNLAAMTLRRRMAWISVLLLSGWATSNAQPVSVEARDYKYAKRLHEAGDYDLAETALKDFQRRHPSSPLLPSVTFLLAECDFHRERYRAALTRFGQFRIEYGASPLDDDALYRIGQSHYCVQQPQEAAQAFGQLTDEYPDSDLIWEARYWLGEAQLALEQHEDATSNYSIAATGEGDVVPYALYSLGWVQQKRQNCTQAAEAYQGVIARFPEHSLVDHSRFGLGECLFEQAAYSDAIRALEQVLEVVEDPSVRAKGSYLVGESQFALGEFDRARASYTQVVSQHPISPLAPQAQYGVGWTYTEQKDLTSAIDAFGQVASRWPNAPVVPQAVFRRAMLHKEIGLRQAAEEAMRSFVDDFPTDTLADDAAFEWGALAFDRNALETAADAFEILTSRYGEWPLVMRGFFMLGETRLAQQRLLDAIGAYSTVVVKADSISPMLPNALFQRGWCFYQRTEYDEALRDFRRVTLEWPGHALEADAHFLIGEALYALGSFGEASKSYQRVTTNHLDSDRAGQAHYGMGWSAFKQGRFNEAITEFESARTKTQSPEIQYDALLRIGDAYFNQADYERALESYRALVVSVETGEAAARAQFQVGQCLLWLDRAPEAVAAYREVVKRFPDAKQVDEAQFMIGWAHFKRDEYEQALGAFRAVVVRYPRSPKAPEAQFGMGEAYYNQGKYRQGIDAYEEMLRRWPTVRQVPDAIKSIWWAYIQLNDLEGAIARTDRFVTDNPTSPVSAQLLLRRADLFYQGQRYDEAAVEYHRVWVDFPSAPLPSSPRFWEAKSLVQLGRTDAAIALFAEVANSTQEIAADAQEQIGEVYLTLSDTVGAFTAYDRYHKKFPTHPKRAAVLIRVGRIYGSAGNSETAEALFREAAGLGGTGLSGGTARIALVRLIMESGRHDDASREAESVISERADEIAAEAQFLLGEISVRQGDQGRALDAYLKVALVYDSFEHWAARGRLGAGEVYRRMGNLSRAETLFTEVMRAHEDDELGVEARERLENMR